MTGPDGTTPLPGIRVRAYLQTGPTSWTLAALADTGADGHYDIVGLATGIYRAYFSDPAGGYVAEYYDNKSDWNLATNFNVTDGGTTPNINASLAGAGKITGKVTAGGGGVGDIVASAWVNVGGSWQSKGSGASASDGNYTIGGLPPGAYRVRFADAYSPPRYVTEYFDNVATLDAATAIPVTAGTPTGNINAAFGGSGSITGKVTGPDGITTIPNIDVEAWQYNTLYQVWDWITDTVTSASGNYTLVLLGGTYRVSFRDPLARPISSRNITATSRTSAAATMSS